MTHVFQELISRYSLDPRLIEIEITESAYVEEYKVITAVVEELRSAGFTVLMDDFGSGYSSLNMLKDVNVDVLKIDMKFLDMDHESVDKGPGNPGGNHPHGQYCGHPDDCGGSGE